MIYDAEAIDLVGQRRDGGLDMFIVSSGPLDPSAATQELLLDKVGNYLDYAVGRNITKDFPGVNRNRIRIVLRLDERPPDVILALCQKIVPWTEDNGVKFVLELSQQQPTG